MSVINGRFARLIGAATAVLVLEHLMVLTDCAIAGRVFGSRALGAMAMIIPMFSVVTLVSVLFAFMIAYSWSAATGRHDLNYASRVARHGLIGSLILGFVLLGVATLLEYPYVSAFAPSEETWVFFDDYWGWFSLVVVLKMVGCLMLCLVFSDNARRICVVAYVVHFLVHPFLAYSFCSGGFLLPGIGMEGISLGTVIAYLVGLAILCRHFTDRQRCGIRFWSGSEGSASAAEPESGGPRYEVLRGSQMTLGDLDGVIELDRLSLDSCYQVSAGDDYVLFKDNPENGLIIRERATKQIVGYSMLLPIRQDMYEKIKTGTFVDTDFKPEMTFKYGKPGIYHLYFASIVVHPEHRSAALVLTMLDAMVEDFVRLATKRGIWFSDMIADVVSNDGVKFCRLFGLKKVCETNHNSSIYEVSGLPPEIRETTPATRKLVSLYRRKHESH